MALFHRSTREAGPHLEWKVRLFILGAALALAGMGTDRPWLISLGIGALLAGFLLRFLSRGGGGGES